MEGSAWDRQPWRRLRGLIAVREMAQSEEDSYARTFHRDEHHRAGGGRVGAAWGSSQCGSPQAWGSVRRRERGFMVWLRDGMRRQPVEGVTLGRRRSSRHGFLSQLQGAASREFRAIVLLC